MKLSSISLFAWIFKLIHKFNPYRLPTLREKRIQMFHQTNQSLIQTQISSIELKHTLQSKKDILNELILWRSNLYDANPRNNHIKVVDQRIAQMEIVIFDLELDYDTASASRHLNMVRLNRITDQLNIEEDDGE